MSDDSPPPPNSTASGQIMTAGMVLLGLVGLLYLPLLIVFLEMICFRTRHCEELLRAVRLHEPLGVIYRPVVDLLLRI